MLVNAVTAVNKGDLIVKSYQIIYYKMNINKY